MAAGHGSIGVSRAPGDRSNLHLIIYPGAHHSFDNDRLQAGCATLATGWSTMKLPPRSRSIRSANFCELSLEANEAVR